jgi:hypothetical protein
MSPNFPRGHGLQETRGDPRSLIFSGTNSGYNIEPPHISREWREVWGSVVRRSGCFAS